MNREMGQMSLSEPRGRPRGGHPIGAFLLIFAESVPSERPKYVFTAALILSPDVQRADYSTEWIPIQSKQPQACVGADDDDHRNRRRAHRGPFRRSAEALIHRSQLNIRVMVLVFSVFRLGRFTTVENDVAILELVSYAT